MWSVSIFCQSPSHHLLYHFISQSQTRGLPEKNFYFKFVHVLLLITSSYICCRHPGNLRFLFTIIFHWYLLGISYPQSQKVKYIWRRILFKKRTKWLSSVEIFKHPNFLLWIPESTESLFFVRHDQYHLKPTNHFKLRRKATQYNWHFPFIREIVFFVWLYSKL